MFDEENATEELETEKAEIETAEGEEEEIEKEEGELKELEEWQKDSATEELEGDKPKPEKSLKQKKKLKGLLSDRENELEEERKEVERLRLENEELKARSFASPEQKMSKRPIREDFEDEDTGEVDTEKYRAELDKYEDDKYEQRQKAKRVEQSKKADTEAIMEEVEAHKERAKNLVETSGMEKELYISATQKFVKIFEDISPGKGLEVAKKIIASLGEGSEKTIYFAGNNEAIRDKIINLVRKDHTGFKLIAFLAAENARLRGITTGKPKTKAPAPAADAKGDISTAPGTAIVSRLKKQYDAAHAKDDDDAAWDIRKKAKAAGVDVGSWT